MQSESAPHAGVNRLSRLDATKALHTAIIEHLDEASAFLALDEDARADQTPPRLAVAGEAGLGKTDAVLRALARPEWKARRVLYLVPSIDLGDELAARAREMGIDARVIRGRSQPVPGRPAGSDERMCAKHEIAEGVATLGFNVTETLCSGPGVDGKRVECPFKDACPYFRQLSESRKGPGLLIGAHQYLPLKMELLKEGDLDLVVIDESFWQSLVRDARVVIDRFRTWRGVGAKGYGPKKDEARKAADARRQEDEADFTFICDKTVAVLDRAIAERREPTLAEFRAAGITSGDCGFAAGIEYSHLGRPELFPDMAEADQREALARAANREAFAFARFWKLLGGELATARDGELHSLETKIGALNMRSGDLENVYALHYTAEPRFQGVPLLMIDADADDVILSRFYPGVRVERIAAEWQNVRIVQCSDRTGSKSAFANPANRERAWNVALDQADRLAETVARDSTRRPLVIAQKSVREAWEADPATTARPFNVAHFGALRGRDGWKNTAGAVIVGRIEPSPAEIERLARSVFYRDETPLAFLLPDATGRVQLPKRPVALRSRAGQSETVAVSYHPDDRADRLLRQVREAELSQALARVRPVHRGADNPCEIIVLTNIPLAIEPDALAGWDDLVPDRFDVMRLRGFLPDVSSDCAVAHPDLWDSATAVRMAASRARRAVPGETVTDLIVDALYEPRYTSMVRARYSLEGSRRARGAWVRVEPGETVEAVERRLQELLPGLYGLCLEGRPPCPVATPEAAEEAVRAVERMAESLAESGEWTWWTAPGAERWPSRRRETVARCSIEPDLAWLSDS